MHIKGTTTLGAALAITLVALAPGLSAQTADVTAVASARSTDAPTFYADALPVFQRKCVACHQLDGPDVGGITAPMSLMTYETARRWAPRIKRAVESGYMPPWGAHVQHKGTFKDERYLEDAEKQALIDWVDAGAPEGDPAQAPTAAEAAAAAGGTTLPPSGWWIGEPDLVVQFAEPVQVPDSVRDWQPTVRMPVPEGAHSEPKWVSKAELRPGGPWVHHIVSSHMGVGVPGRGPFTFPEGWGVLIAEDPFITVNMHYHKEPGPGTAVEDMTRAGFVFYEPGDVIDYVVQTDLNFTRQFTIPAGDPNFEVKHERAFEEDTYLLSMGPHMHYRGKSMKYELEYPDGSMETLLWVPDYDFSWQFLYEYEEPLFVPAGSTLHMTWWFDNSAENAFNPDPTADVVYGAATTDEMANARIYFAPVTKRGIVVGEEIPADLLEQARAREERRRRAIGVRAAFRASHENRATASGSSARWRDITLIAAILPMRTCSPR
jgi:mono/diheme cytochrome c family protein